MTAWRRVHRTLPAAVRSGVLAGFRLSAPVPVLMLDAKHFVIRRKPYTLYLAFNAPRSRPISWLLLPRYELRVGYDRILGHMKRNGVDIPGVVSDGHIGLGASVHDWYPFALHQRCAFHVLAEVLRKLGGRSFLRHGGRRIWNRVRHIAIGADTLHAARCALSRIRQAYPDYARAWHVPGHQLKGIYIFEKNPALLKPYRTSNRIENCMGVIEQRLKTFRSMKSPDQCAKIIASFIGIKYRKPTKK